jgi:hypothetical protein
MDTIRTLILASIGAVCVACADDSDSGPGQADAGQDGSVVADAAQDGTVPDASGSSPFVYTGGPVCDTLGVNWQGNVAGASAQSSTTPSSLLRGTTFQTVDGTDDNGNPKPNLALSWNSSLQVASFAEFVTGSTITLPPFPSSDKYCIVAGRIRLAPQQPASGSELQFLITKLSRSVAGTCDTATVEADIKGCIELSLKAE